MATAASLPQLTALTRCGISCDHAAADHLSGCPAVLPCLRLLALPHLFLSQFLNFNPPLPRPATRSNEAGAYADPLAAQA